MRRRDRERERELEYELRWGDLARYNAEVARGIVHTEEWDQKMAKKQAAWLAAQGIEMVDTPVGPRPYQDGRPIASFPDPVLVEDRSKRFKATHPDTTQGAWY